MINEIDLYISNFPPEIQLVLQKVRKTIRETAPGAEETIKYQIPTQEIPFDLISKIVKFRAEENRNNALLKKSKKI